MLRFEAVYAIVVLAPALDAYAIQSGQRIEPFTLKSAAGAEVALATRAGTRATTVIFVATRCLVSNAYNARMSSLAAEYEPKGVSFVGVNSNRQESPDEVEEHVRQHDLRFRVYKDPETLGPTNWARKSRPRSSSSTGVGTCAIADVSTTAAIYPQ
jgi:hypothetical protein